MTFPCRTWVDQNSWRSVPRCSQEDQLGGLPDAEVLRRLLVAYQYMFACSNCGRSLVLRLYSLLLVHSPPALAVVTSSLIVPSREFDVAVSAVVDAAAIIVSSLFCTLPFSVPIVS